MRLKEIIFLFQNANFNVNLQQQKKKIQKQIILKQDQIWRFGNFQNNRILFEIRFEFTTL